MKKIYWIEAEAIWPVCEAGAVVIANDVQEAKELTKKLYKPAEPKCIGQSKLKSQVVVLNTGDY